MPKTPARRFEATETTTYRDLQNTMRRLGATSLRVPRDLLDPKAKGAEIIFDRAGRRYVVRCAKWPAFLDNLRAAERTIYYLYLAIDNYGATTNASTLEAGFAQFFAGFEALPDDTALLMLTDGSAPWHEVLGVRLDAAKADVISAFRALARTHHPDAGGDPAMFKQLRRAYEQGLAARSAA